ncbi:MAG: prephenate dehydratase [Fervidobacterium sp.]|nr:prephenate dehydratase [Fervidobacterium sp.]
MEKRIQIEKLREVIDSIDSKLIHLLNQRLELAIKIGRLKDNIYDEKREQEVLNHVKNLCSNLLVGEEFCVQLYEKIMEKSKQLQESNVKLIGFQGEHGAYSEISGVKFGEKIFSDRAKFATIPLKSFEEVIQNVEHDIIDYGVLPIQNSLEGPINTATYALLESNLNVVAEVILPINHCLLILPDVDPKEIKFVYSHPQALAQCRNFLKRLSLQPLEFFDTAGAAKKLADERNSNAAVIASKLAAKIYGLEVLKDNIQDYPYNKTSFWILSKVMNNHGSKCAITFLLEDKPGALLSVLELFKLRNINLTRIVSLPSRNEVNEYRFFVDFETQNVDDLEKFLKTLAEKTKQLRVFGLYDSFEINDKL